MGTKNTTAEIQDQKALGPPLRLKAEGCLTQGDLVIHSARLTIRPISREHADDIFREFTPQITRFLIAQPTGQFSDTLGYIERAAKERAAGRDLAVVIFETTSGQFLGAGGIHSRAIHNEPVLGIWLKREAHGRGYGREAVAALCDWARQNLDYTGLIYDVDRENTPSRRIAESLGGVIVGEMPTPRVSCEPLDTIIYRIPLEGTETPRHDITSSTPSPD